jgi:hypothetical protein
MIPSSDPTAKLPAAAVWPWNRSRMLMIEAMVK